LILVPSFFREPTGIVHQRNDFEAIEVKVTVVESVTDGRLEPPVESFMGNLSQIFSCKIEIIEERFDRS